MKPCPECGEGAVITTAGPLPVCRACDWTGWPHEYEPGDRVYLDMPGDPHDGRIGVIEVGHPIYLDKPWQCVRIAEQLVNLPEVLLRPVDGGDAAMP